MHPCRVVHVIVRSEVCVNSHMLQLEVVAQVVNAQEIQSHLCHELAYPSTGNLSSCFFLF